MAFRLVECAIVDKQSRAFQQIADHLDGKPLTRQSMTVARLINSATPN